MIQKSNAINIRFKRITGLNSTGPLLNVLNWLYVTGVLVSIICSRGNRSIPQSLYMLRCMYPFYPHWVPQEFLRIQ